MIHIIRRLIYIESKTQAHYDHLVYCNFYAIFAFIYSCLIMPSIYLELRDLISNIDSGTKSKSMDFISSNLDDMIKTNSTTLEYDINIPSDFAASISPMVSNVSYDFYDVFSEYIYTDSLSYDDYNLTLGDSEDHQVADLLNFSGSVSSFNEFLLFLILNMAYSCKLLIYILFSRHLKCFFRMNGKDLKSYDKRSTVNIV